MNIKLIVGIGNVENKYTNTRHNFGHKYVQLLAKTKGVILKKNNILHGYIGKLYIQNYITYLLIPNSYINNSGLSVSKCINFYKLSLQEVLIAHDELDLFPGMIRINLGKNNNTGHRGVKDIINQLNNRCDFYRLRIGIGRPEKKNDIINFVLSPPSFYEKEKIDYIIKKTILYTEDIIFKNFIKVMNILHVHKYL